MKAALTLLRNLIRFPSLPGQEREAMEYLAEAFAPVVDEVSLIPIPPEITQDPEYSWTMPDICYDGQGNLRAVLRGTGGGRSLIINTHADVVPASEGQEAPFEPMLRSGYLYGRGACDAKGQIATLWRALELLRASGRRPRGDLIVHIVAEEENGGNGALALVRGADRAEAALVLEPTDSRMMIASRGAVWFRITCTGRPAHAGMVKGRVSALTSAVAIMRILEDYHERLLGQSRDLPLFAESSDPMPLTIGRLRAGTWPGTVPGEAVLEGVFGFLPNRTREQVMAELHESIRARGGTWLRAHFAMEFPFRHDPHVTPDSDPLVRLFQQCLAQQGLDPTPAALLASSDAWLYQRQFGIPVLLFGPGALRDAHSNRERIRIADLEAGACVLADFILRWCDDEGMYGDRPVDILQPVSR
ncbi:MAG: M20 family metallopeptidase [Anaerolineae bacterium]